MSRDLKPNKILVNQDCDVVICDFGLARMASECYANKYNDMPRHEFTK